MLLWYIALCEHTLTHIMLCQHTLTHIMLFEHTLTSVMLCYLNTKCVWIVWSIHQKSKFTVHCKYTADWMMQILYCILYIYNDFVKYCWTLLHT